MNMFANASKIQRKITKKNSCLELQNDLVELYERSQKWQTEFNAEKGHVLKFGRSGMRPDWEYELGNDSHEVGAKKRPQVRRKTQETSTAYPHRN